MSQLEQNIELDVPPEAWARAHRALRLATKPLERFLHLEAASGVMLIALAAVALVWANSPWAASYDALWHTTLGLRVGSFVFERSLHWVVNDGLMTIFFFVVGLEIRREIHHGELSDLQRAALPVAAAVGGMVVPACIYLLLASEPPAQSGWGVPMATDIAFALGVLTLLGKRVPAALRVLLLALAVIDDLGAILVIALFYSDGVALSGLLVAFSGVLIALFMQRVGIRRKFAYVPPAIVAWAGAYASGVHPTIAGVLIGVITPVRAWLGADHVIPHLQRRVLALESVLAVKGYTADQLAHELKSLEKARREALSPAEALISALHPWVAFGIMPLFALANAGVSLGGVSFEGAGARVAMGAALGLALGKPIGVMLASLLAVRLRLAILPVGIGLRELFVLGLTAGIGFTMSLFIAQLAFASEELLSAAKLSVLVASAGAAVLGLVMGRFLLKGVAPGAAQSADEAESETTR